MSAVIGIVKNPFDPSNTTSFEEFDNTKSVQDYADKFGINKLGFPFVCVLNGDLYLLKDEWAGFKPSNGDKILFTPVVGDPFSVVALVVFAIVIGVSISLMTPTPGLAGTRPEADSVYDLRGQRNRLKLGEVVEELFGNGRYWPPYAAPAYQTYEDNQQFLYQVFALRGRFTFGQMFIDDTEIENFEEIEVEVVQPGDTMTLFQNNVVTASEVGGIELFGKNEDEYPDPDGFVGPFTLNPSGTTTDHIEFDFVFPRGLYFANDEGGLSTRTATVEAQFRIVGEEVWIDFPLFTKSLATTTPQRFTVSHKGLFPARYEVRVRRGNTSEVSHRAGDTIEWEGARAYLPNAPIEHGVTVLAVKSRASNNLNNDSRNLFNLFYQRLLDVYDLDTQQYLPLQATSNPIAALSHIAKAPDGGNLSDSFLDLTELWTMADAFDEDGIEFNGFFDKSSNLWSVLKTCLRVGRAVPMLKGSILTVVRDQPRTVATGMFNRHNIVPGSFSVEYNFAKFTEHDGVEVEYTDPVTAKQKTVMCRLDGIDPAIPENPEKMILRGCTSRDLAFREGMFRRRQMKLLREQVKFKTSEEGFIPFYGDQVYVANNVLSQALESGRIFDLVGTTLTLDRNVIFELGKTYVVILKDILGKPTDPIVVTETGTPNIVTLASPPVGTFIFDDANRRPTVFIFGEEDTEIGKYVITHMAPAGNGQLSISAHEDLVELYTDDDATAPDEVILGTPFLLPAVGDIEELSYTPFIFSSTEGDFWTGVPSSSTIQLSWAPVVNAQSYIVERSSDGIDWERVSTVLNSLAMVQVDQNTPTHYFRVAPVNGVAGNFAVLIVDSEEIFAVVEGTMDPRLSAPWFGVETTLVWTQIVSVAPGRKRYRVRVFDPNDSPATLIRTYEIANQGTGQGDFFDYLGSFTVIGDSWLRNPLFEVATLQGRQTGGNRGRVRYTENVVEQFQAFNEPPPIVQGVFHVFLSQVVDTRNYTLTWLKPNATVHNDLDGYRVWLSTTQGFTPGAGTLYDTINDPDVLTSNIAIDAPGGTHVAYYIRVAAVDKYGDDVFNLAPELTIPAN